MRFVWLSILCGVQVYGMVACLMTVTEDGWRALLFGATVLLTQYLNSGRDYLNSRVKYYIRGNWILENITESHANTRACI